MTLKHLKNGKNITRTHHNAEKPLLSTKNQAYKKKET